MKKFLAEFWPWLLVPCVLVAAGLIWLAAAGNRNDALGPYNLF